MRDIFVTLAVFGSLPFILYHPYIGVLVWSWIGYMNPHRLSWGFASDFPFAMIVGITTLVAVMFSSEPKKIPWTRETIILVLFIFWMGVTTLTSVHFSLASSQYIEVIKIQLMTFVTMMLMTDRRRIELLVWVIALSLGFYGVKGGIFTLTSGGGYHVMGPSNTFIGGNNEIGLALIMTLPLMRYLQLQARQVWIKWGLTGAMALTLVAILGTQSRGALLGLAAMMFMLLWKSRRRVTMLVVLGAVLYGGVQFMPGSWHERMETIKSYQHDQSALGRINAWHFAFNLAKDRPLVGGGYQAFTRDMFAIYAPDPEDVHDAHSIYFEVLGEHGFVGLTLYLALGWFAWRSCAQVGREAKLQPGGLWLADLVRMLQVSLVGYASSGAFLGLAYFDLYYHLVALVVLAKVQSKRLAEVTETSNGVETVQKAVTPQGPAGSRYEQS